jgi:beta-galactosidase GanA
MGLLEFRLKQMVQPRTGAWQQVEVRRRGSTLLGISFRPLQAEAFGLEVRPTLQALLNFPFQVIRLGAYWNRMEPTAGVFQFDELDWQIEAAEAAGKQIILCVGPLKTFGYPEFFVPAHYLRQPFPEHKLVTPSQYPDLLQATTEFINKLVERYKDHKAITTWQLEHDAVDPLGVEHSWRLSADFVEMEAQAIRKADPSRPMMMNGFLPTSLPVRLNQWWQTRDQGDSLAVAQRLADMVGIDFYPRHALIPLGTRALYLDGSQSPSHRARRKQLLEQVVASHQKVLVTEGQAEPWEAVTVPANPLNQAMYSCLPEHVIINFNNCVDWFGEEMPLHAYLFWGAEYWMLRKKSMDSSYVRAFERVLEES